MMRSPQFALNLATLRRDTLDAGCRVARASARPLLFVLVTAGAWIAGPLILGALLGEPMLVLAQ